MLKTRYESFKNNYLAIGLSICNILLLVSMPTSPEAHDVFFWFNMCFRAAFPFIAFTFGNRGMWIAYFLYTNILSLDMTYDNFTGIAVISLLFALSPAVNVRKAIFMTIFYLTDVFIVATLHHKQPWHIYVHLVGCAGFCMAMWELKVSHNTSELKLLPDERIILEQLAEGKQQKEVQGFSESTVCRKLQKAAERNKLSTEELKMQFCNTK